MLSKAILHPADLAVSGSTLQGFTGRDLLLTRTPLGARPTDFSATDGFAHNSMLSSWTSRSFP